MKRVLAFVVVCLLTARTAAEAPLREVAAFGKHFSDRGLVGTFVIADAAGKELRAWNLDRAKTRFIPASTFKIANSLIGLETGAVKGLDEVLPYGGKPQMLKEWEQDLPMREAMKVSSVPVYQELARRIGAERMAAGVKSLNYGNMETAGVIDRFWLDGPLKISAVEQVEFIRRLLADELPIKKETMLLVRGIVPVENAGKTVIHYKTGWCTAGDPQIGWIVGWVENGESKSPFALNIDMKVIEDAPKRMLVLKDCLRELGEAGTE